MFNIFGSGHPIKIALRRDARSITGTYGRGLVTMKTQKTNVPKTDRSIDCRKKFLLLKSSVESKEKMSVIGSARFNDDRFVYVSLKFVKHFICVCVCG